MTDKSEVNHRIRFAYYLPGWTYEEGDKGTLKREAQRLTPEEYDGEMDGFIFCPACFTNLNRIPKEKDYFSNGRNAYFAHMKAYRKVPCDLRSQKPEGKRYKSYEEAWKAIENQDLIVVSGFLGAEPALPEDQNREYNETPVEDTNGPISELPIARHSGESFPLPSRITTVAGICRNFPDNLYKYYVLPNRQYPVRLVDMLVDVSTVIKEDNEPRLYYGKVKRSFNAGRTSNNMRMTKLACHPDVTDFYLKDTDRVAQRKGIHDDTAEQIVLIYGAVSVSGVGFAFQNLGWGEYALLPEKYKDLLD